MPATSPRDSRTLHRRTSTADAELLRRQPACHQSSHGPRVASNEVRILFG
jgi:hypothetical protein